MPQKSSKATEVLSTLRSAFGGPEALDEPRPLEQMVLLVLAAGADMRRARGAMKRLESEYVDWNEVRVTSSYELRRMFRSFGARGAHQRAEQIKDLLSTAYNRFNKLDLSFFHGRDLDTELERRRDRFMNWLSGRFPAVAVMMTLHGKEPGEVVVQGGLPRVLGRLGLCSARNPTITASRKALRAHFPEEAWVSAQWCLYELSESFCHSRGPDCLACPVAERCKTGAPLKRKEEAAQKRAQAARSRKTKATSGRKKTSRKTTAKKTTKTTKRKATKTTKRKAAKKKTTKKKTTGKTTRKKAPSRKAAARRRPARKATRRR